MERIFDEIKNEIVSEFGIKKNENLEVVRQVNAGFSGAEVYCINLKNDSNRKGKFFLKIDKDASEYHNSQEAKFSRAGAQYLEKKNIKDYYVLLIDVAGKNIHEYSSFLTIESPIKQKEILELVFGELFTDAVKIEKLVDEPIGFMQMMKKNLGNKLAIKGEIYNYLEKKLGIEDINSIKGLQIGDRILPNPYTYASEEEKSEAITFELLKCYQHGDFHGENLFVSKEKNEYSIIDFAFCKEDGVLFFDSAYFSLSLLLRVFEGTSLVKYIDVLTKIIEEKWDDIDIKYIKAIQQIDVSENFFIETVCDERHRYNDLMKKGKYIARVLAGLNFSGKKNIDDDLREKAFFFAALYLKKLFEYCGFEKWKDSKSLKWNVKENAEVNREVELQRLVYECNYFSQELRFILVIGDDYDNVSCNIEEGIGRLPLSGVLSFCNNDKDKGLRDNIDSVRLLKYINLMKEDNIEIIKQNKTWWMYANGVSFNPDTISNSFASWRNLNGRFLETIIKAIGEKYSPDEIVLLVDLNSFRNCKKHLVRLLEWFDYIETAEVNAAILTPDYEASTIDEKNYQNIKINKHKLDLSNVSQYCMENFQKNGRGKLYIPHIDNKLGVFLNKENEDYINEYVILVNDVLVERESLEAYTERYSFYWGKPITWTAISEKLYIARKEEESLIASIDAVINREKNEVGIVSVPHSPGAGASVLCRIICWNIRNSYPTIIVPSINEGVYECCKRLSSLSGKYLIILLDGDYSKNDVMQFRARLKNMNIKSVILYSYRQYKMSNGVAGEIKECQLPLDVLTSDMGLIFKERYMDKVKLRKLYLPEEEEVRKENLHNLSTNSNFMRFRLPFFYGMYAFEKDFIGIEQFLDGIFEILDVDERYKKIIGFLAIVSYFTSERGIFPKLVLKILKIKSKSSNSILHDLQEKFPNLVYSTYHNYRICHPIIALKILERMLPGKFPFQSLAFLNICKNLVEDLKACAGGSDSFDKLDELLMELFIKRDTEGDLENGIKRENFSQIFLALENKNFQEELFGFLAEKFPNNAHIAHHYGRLLIANSPTDLGRAKEQFDRAIALEEKNHIHYHARGNAYAKYIMYCVNNKIGMENSMDVYDKTASLVDLSIADYEKAIELSELSNDISSLSYPYISIIKICTFAINSVLKSFGKNQLHEFFALDNCASVWCKRILGLANNYDLDTERRYSDIRENEKYRVAKTYLTSLNFSREDLKEMIKRDATNQYLKISFLSTIDNNTETWKKLSQIQLKEVCEYCEELMLNGDVREGVIWKWFMSYSNLESFDYSHYFSCLESLKKLENNLTANFLLYIGYFAKFCETKDVNLGSRVKEGITACKKLGKNDRKFQTTQLYYSGIGNFPITMKSEGCKKLKGTVSDEIKNVQSGYVTLDINPKFSAFFVPAHTELKKEQAFGKKIETIIGFSYDGLRAWEVKLIEEANDK